MASVPINMSRVPNLLSSQLTLSNISRTGVELVKLQSQLSSGLKFDTASGDPIGASLVGVINERLNQSDQLLRNFSNAGNALATLDQALSQASDIALEARSIASSQVGVGSDAGTRASQAEVVQSLIDELARLSNTQFDGLFLLGGDRTANAPVQSFAQGFRYLGAGDGLQTNLSGGINAPITIGGDQAFGALDGRIQGDVDLNPRITAGTRLRDLTGATGAGFSAQPLGSIQISVTNGPTTTLTVDLSDAKNVGDVTASIESAIRQADPAALAGVFPAGVTIGAAGDAFSLNVNPGVSITVQDLGAGDTAANLGLSGFTYTNAAPENLAIDLDPRLTGDTTFGQLSPSSPIDFGDVIFRNASRVGSVSITPGMSIADFQAAVERLNLGVRIEISPDGHGLDAINEVSGSRMSIEEAGAGTFTATTIGLRSFKPGTDITTLNDGRGVQIADGAIDPVTGLPDPARNVDLEITLSDGSTFQIDFTPSDMLNVQTVLDRINAEAAAAGLGAVFTATLGDAGNGLLFEDGTGGGGALSVAQLNGRAAEDLGLLGGIFTPGAPATFAGEDRATVRVDSMLTALLELRDALQTDDSTGITFAGERIEAGLERIAQTRAVVGGRVQRVQSAAARQEDSNLLDQIIKSNVQDLDFVGASGRFSLLQLAMQAGLSSAAQTQSLSLLNFLP